MILLIIMILTIETKGIVYIYIFDVNNKSHIKFIDFHKSNIIDRINNIKYFWFGFVLFIYFFPYFFLFYRINNYLFYVNIY